MYIFKRKIQIQQAPQKMLLFFEKALIFFFGGGGVFIFFCDTFPHASALIRCINEVLSTSGLGFTTNQRHVVGTIKRNCAKIYWYNYFLTVPAPQPFLTFPRDPEHLFPLQCLATDLRNVQIVTRPLLLAPLRNQRKKSEMSHSGENIKLHQIRETHENPDSPPQVNF